MKKVPTPGSENFVSLIKIRHKGFKPVVEPQLENIAPKWVDGPRLFDAKRNMAYYGNKTLDDADLSECKRADGEITSLRQS